MPKRESGNLVLDSISLQMRLIEDEVGAHVPRDRLLVVLSPEAEEALTAFVTSRLTPHGDCAVTVKPLTPYGAQARVFHDLTGLSVAVYYLPFTQDQLKQLQPCAPSS